MIIDRPLVDAHCHTVVRTPLDRTGFERFLTEADAPPPPGVSYGDTPLGLAVRRWCAPLLDLPAGVSMADYVARRAELGPHEVGARTMSAAGLSHLLVDTGIGREEEFVRPESLGMAADALVREVVRLEHVAEELATLGVNAAGFAESYVERLAEATRDAVGVKSILAYRHGFDVDPARPGPDEVRAAAERWLAGETRRLADPVLLRFVLWCGIDRGLPVQMHCGFGDRDLRLHLVNPALLQPFLAAAEPSGTPIVLLHCYPHQREAGWLAATYPAVHVDVGLTLSHVGIRAKEVLAEFCELAPFGKLLFSTDAYGVPDLYYVGAAQFRYAFGSLLTRWWRSGAATADDIERIAAMVGAENARRLYAL